MVAAGSDKRTLVEDGVIVSHTPDTDAGWADDPKMVEVVAEALRGAMPWLVQPEAWPWLTLAKAALGALDAELRTTAASPISRRG
jgi:hypothetical protein